MAAPPDVRLVTLLYLLGRDHLPLGAITVALRAAETAREVIFTAEPLEDWARQEAARLLAEPTAYKCDHCEDGMKDVGEGSQHACPKCGTCCIPF